MEGRRRALIIGAGLGGIATAGRLARAGMQVTVLEKNAQPGGRCDQLVVDGHRFDTGPTLLLMPDVFRRTYAALGGRMEDLLDLHRIDPTYRLHSNDGLRLDLTSDLSNMAEQLESLEPGSSAGLMAFLAEGRRHYQVALDRFVTRQFKGWFDYFSPANLPLLIRLKALVKHYDYTGRFFKSDFLRAAFSFQNMYLGLSPYRAPATFSLLQTTELVDGVWYPTGGMYAVVQTLVRLAETNGARFHYNAPVQRIEVEGRRAVAVRLADGQRLEADVIIANADLPYVYEELLQDRRASRELDRKAFTSSAIMFYWGVGRVFPQLRHHNVFLAGDYQASFRQIFDDLDLPASPSFYINAPTRTDPSAAPAGQDSLMVLVPAGHLDEEHPQEWGTLKERARQSVFSGLAKIGIHDLARHIKFEVAYTPQDWARLYNLKKGAAFGLSHNFSQVGYLRPQNRHAKVDNLYFVGASTHPGTGLPMVLISAELTSRRVLSEQLPAAERWAAEKRASLVLPGDPSAV